MGAVCSLRAGRDSGLGLEASEISGLKQVVEQVVGEFRRHSECVHDPLDGALRLRRPDLRSHPRRDKDGHRGTRRIWMFFCEDTGRPPRVAGLYVHPFAARMTAASYTG